MVPVQDEGETGSVTSHTAVDEGGKGCVCVPSVSGFISVSWLCLSACLLHSHCSHTCLKRAVCVLSVSLSFLFVCALCLWLSVCFFLPVLSVCMSTSCVCKKSCLFCLYWVFFCLSVSYVCGVVYLFPSAVMSVPVCPSLLILFSSLSFFVLILYITLGFKFLTYIFSFSLYISPYLFPSNSLTAISLHYPPLPLFILTSGATQRTLSHASHSPCRTSPACTSVWRA